MKRLNNAGFTLMELLIVVAIIGILAALAIPNLLDAQDRAKQRATVGELRGWGTALSAYYTDRSGYPDPGASDGSLATIKSVHSQLVPYSVSSLNVEDLWNNPFWYYSNEIDSYTIQSAGKDGIAPYDGTAATCVSPTTWQTFNLSIVLEDGLFVCVP